MRYARIALRCLLAASVSSAALAQTPEVALFFDLRPTYFQDSGMTSRVRWFDPLGRYSVIGFHIILETGNRIKITQRLEKIDNDGDPDSLDEYYIESRGTWRVGKQYLPFGQQNILRETVPAARYDTALVFEDVPIQIAVCDNGSRLTKGVVARIGRSVGISLATGNHFAVQGTALTQFQRPEDGVGRGRGYRLAYGFDATYDAFGGVFDFEWVALRDGETILDDNRDLTDLRFRFSTRKTNYVVTIAWSKSWNRSTDWYRIQMEMPVTNKFTWEPFVRLKGMEWSDVGLTLHIRL